MRVAYLIIAHANPVHLSRLIKALQSDNAQFFIHIDRKVRLEMFSASHAANVRFCRRREAVHWGEFSLVAAALRLLRDALAEPNPADIFVLLSGSDYPLFTARQIEDFFGRNAPREYINVYPIPDESIGKPLSRLTVFAVPTGTPLRLGIRITRKLLQAIGLLPVARDYRAALGGLQPYGGSGWWALTGEACRYIEAFAQQRAKVVRFFRNSWIPDEMFFQTIIGNSPFRSRTTGSLTYTRWASRESRSPEPIGAIDLELFSKSSACIEDGVAGATHLFARKFGDEDPTIVDRLDRIIASR